MLAETPHRWGSPLRHAPAALALYEGPGHVIVKVSAVFAANCDFDPVGLPAREAFPGHEAAQSVMDRVYATGQTAEVTDGEGLVFIAPRVRSGRVIGVATHWTPVRPRTPQATTGEGQPAPAP